MNIFNLLSGFWRVSEDECFTTSEAALYLFLLHMANKQMWRMPIRCPTIAICNHIKTSKQNVMKAREGLKRRGIISFIPGTGTKNYALYTLKEPSDKLYGQLSEELSPRLSGQLSLYNIEKDKEYLNNKAREKNNSSLEELENIFLDDQEWQHSVLSLLLSKNVTSVTIENLKIYISQFFQYLKASGYSERETNDCKNHFVNWLIKQPINRKNYNEKSRPEYQDRYKPNNVNDTPTEAYYETF